ncbi:MAG: hypothetical protein M0Z61_18160 [Nitrospiraceae bacterium]|nr:hypothetical protein [Nitrospiraceae bacterium]
MGMIIKKTVYFEKPGRENTGDCVSVVKDAVKEYGYRHLVLATTTGDTALAMGAALNAPDMNVVAVTHSAGFKEPNTMDLAHDIREQIISTGIKIFTGPMLTHSLETSLNHKFNGIYPTMIIGQSLKRFGEGSKVALEIVMMAADAGLIPEGEEVLAVAGTARGADTVLLVRSAVSKRFLELRVLEVLAKPRV